MTLSISLLVFFVLGETLAFVLHMFGYGATANSLGFWLSVITLVVHGSTVLLSTIVLGWSNYFKLFKCWLECIIIAIDAIALWYSVKSWIKPNAIDLDTFFVLFGAVIILHAIRIFHIFYITLKPRSSAITPGAISIKMNPKSTSSSTRRSGSNSDQEIYSIDGILINRMYSNMKFAAQSLLRPIIEDGLTDLFSMEFY